MFISMLSSLDGFKLTLPSGEEINISLLRTAGMNVATLGIDCPKSILIEKTESTLPELEKAKQNLIREIDDLTAQYNPLIRDTKNRNPSAKKPVTYKKKTKQPLYNESKPFPSGGY